MLLSASVARLCRRDYIRPRQTTPDHPRPNAYMKPPYPTSGSQVRSLDSSEERQVSQGDRNCAISLQASHPIRDHIRVLPGRRRGSRSRLGGEAHPSPVHNPPAPLICLQRGGSSEAHNACDFGGQSSGRGEQGWPVRSTVLSDRRLEEPGFHFAFSLDFDHAPRFKHILVA